MRSVALRERAFAGSNTPTFSNSASATEASGGFYRVASSEEYRVGLKGSHSFEFPSGAQWPSTVCLTAVFGKIGRKSLNHVQAFTPNPAQAREAMARSNIVVDLGANDEAKAGVISILTMCVIIAIPIHFNIIRYLR